MPSKRSPVSTTRDTLLELTGVRSNKCRVTCAYCGRKVVLWCARASLPEQQVSVPHQLQHDCQQLMFLNTFFYSKAYFLHQHHLSTNKSGHFQTSWLLFARLYNYSLLTTAIRVFAHKDNNTNPIQASCYLSHNIYWSTPRSPRSRLLLIRYLLQLA